MSVCLPKWEARTVPEITPSPVAHSELECLALGFLDGPRETKPTAALHPDPHNWNELTGVQH